MPPDQPTPGSAIDWLRRARSDLALACAPRLPDVLYNDLCFHAQQAVEKSLKAILINYGIEFRKVHNIDYLVGLLPADLPLPPVIADAMSLTSYAVMLRYPGDYEEITEAEYQEAVQTARAILTWAEQVLSRGSPRGSQQ